jgi:hypothetical protein
LYALLGLIIGAFTALFSLLGAAIGAAGAESTEGADAALGGVLIGVGSIIFFPLFYGILGFIGGLLSAFLYHLIPGLIRGIKIELE